MHLNTESRQVAAAPVQVSVEALGGLERSMKVEVPEERIAAQVRDRLQQLSRTTRILGCLHGKASLKIIQQRFGQQVRREVIGAVLQESFLEAVDREQLRPAGAPRIEPVEAAEGAG